MENESLIIRLRKVQARLNISKAHLARMYPCSAGRMQRFLEGTVSPSLLNVMALETLANFVRLFRDTKKVKKA